MDPIAHTLAGATLSQTGLRHRTPLATPTLVIGANLPDIDGVVSFVNSDTALYYRRGITHGVLAQLILPCLLTGGIMAYDRWIRRRLHRDKPPVKPGQVLLLSYLGVLSHPFLDWLNTYGVRLLMPFSGRWFYGDTLFIIDAWMWLLMAAAVVFAYSHTRLSQGLWVTLGLATSSLITLTDFVPPLTKLVWWLGLALIIAARIRGVTARQNQGVAIGCVTAFCLYLAAMSAGNVRAKEQVQTWLREQHGDRVRDVMIGPLPGQPFGREVIVVGQDRYYGLKVPLFGDASIEPLFEPVPIQVPDPIVQIALGHEDIRGFVNWMRFPLYEVQDTEAGYRVVIRDLRYVRPGQTADRGIGMVSTLVPRAAVTPQP
jgi:inner membrane protein